MSYTDHNAREINVKVVWLGDVARDFASFKGWWRLRSKWNSKTLERGQLEILDLRLPPYETVHGYHVRYHLYGPSPEAVDAELWVGTEVAVVAPEFEHVQVDASVVRIARDPASSPADVARRVVDVVLGLLDGSIVAPARPPVADEQEYVHVGPFPFLVNLPGLEPEVDENAARARLRLTTPSGLVLTVLVYPAADRDVADVFAEVERVWGPGERTEGPVIAGFRFERRCFATATGNYEVLACKLRDSLLAATLAPHLETKAVDALRQLFLLMIEGAIIRSPENRPVG